MRTTFLFFLFCCISFQLLCAQQVELGTVNWMRDYNKALAIAKQENKDVLILFQEVPGCATCRNYGHNVLSHPLIAEAIEQLFVPLAIFNNKNGKDKDVLALFNEPSWNNPVIRIIDSKGKTLVPRIGGDYTAATLCNRMQEALNKKNKPIPKYLDLLSLELASAASSEVSEKFFEMHCFWTGEKQLGNIKGVLSAQSGFMNKREVVKVKYDPHLVSAAQLEVKAKSNQMTPIQETSYTASPKDQYYYLQHSNYTYLPLTSLQKTKINSALGSKKTGEIYLSPQQKKWLEAARYQKKTPTILWNKKLRRAWQIKMRQDG